MDLLPFFQNQVPPQQRSMGEPVVNIENSREWVAIKVCFDTPDNMNKNESKYSPSFSCLERMWKLGIVKFSRQMMVNMLITGFFYNLIRRRVLMSA